MPVRLSSVALFAALLPAGGCVATPDASDMWSAFERNDAPATERVVYASEQRRIAGEHAFWGWVGTAAAGAGTVALASLTANNYALDQRDHWDGPWEMTLSLSVVAAVMLGWTYSEDACL